MTPAVFLRRSSWLVGSLVLLMVTAFVGRLWLSRQAATEQQVIETHRQAAKLAALGRSFNETEQTTLAATIPSEALLPQVYQSIEALAARQGVTLAYNFSGAPLQDPALVQATAAKDSWVIPVDWLGPRAKLEAILRELETGPYLLKIHSYRFDVTEPSENSLSTTLILYGR